MSHTAGPWKFWDREDTEHALITDESGKCGIARPIARIRTNEVEAEEMRANARLIAGAPKLWEACVSARDVIVSYLESEQCLDIDDRRFMPVLNLLTDALDALKPEKKGRKK